LKSELKIKNLTLSKLNVACPLIPLLASGFSLENINEVEEKQLN